MSKVADLTSEQRDQYRIALRGAREEFLQSEFVNKIAFPDWMDNEYGVIMLRNDDGYYTMNYDVADEKRFMLFQLKFFGQHAAA